MRFDPDGLFAATHSGFPFFRVAPASPKVRCSTIADRDRNLLGAVGLSKFQLIGDSLKSNDAGIETSRGLRLTFGFSVPHGEGTYGHSLQENGA
jgi:hypothetical protein